MEKEPESLHKLLENISVMYCTPEELIPLKPKVEARLAYLRSITCNNHKDGKLVIDMDKLREQNQCYQFLEGFGGWLVYAEMRKREKERRNGRIN